MNKLEVVIVGGGFGGLRTALELIESNDIRVTLISDKKDFRYYPALYRTATGGRQKLSIIPISELIKNKPIHFIKDQIVELDAPNQTIKSKSGKKYKYNALVLSLGVNTNYFGIEGLEEYSYGIKTVADAERLKQHLHQQLIEKRHPDLNYVVVGGGPTGIELAGTLPHYLKLICRRHAIKRPKIHVDLIESAPRLIPRLPKDMSRVIARQLRRLGVKLYLSTAVQAQTADALMINNKKIMSHTVIWTAGVTNHPFFKQNNFQLATNGKVRVDQYLQYLPGVYVIGDNADTPYSGMAQTALHDGKFVAQNLRRIANKIEPLPYQAKKPIYVLPAGPRWSAVLWGSIRIYGWLGYLLRRAADLVAYHDYEPFYQATERWLSEDDSEESCSLCKGL